MTPLRASFALAAATLALCSTLGGCAVTSVTHPDGTPSVSVSTVPADTVPADTVPAGKGRAPDATGTIEAVHLSDGPISISFTPDPGFEYFAGTTFNVSPVAFPHGQDGVTLTAADLSVGTHINVWVTGCSGSAPVQCDVERVELAP